MRSTDITLDRCLLILLVVSSIGGCGPESRSVNPSTADTRSATATAPQFTGSESCAGCHRTETSLWSDSHHALAMAPASDATVEATFDQLALDHDGLRTTIFRQDDVFRVATGPEHGSRREFTVTHTFGIDPLQQYLLDFPGGRRQALTLAWDNRAVELGGQRWFELYPEESIASDDPLHWTGRFFTWNSMCAECHSTNLIKGYALSDDAFETTWSEVNVGCEACHGPGSRHVADPEVAMPVATAGERNWIFEEDRSIATLVGEDRQTRELDACAVCHSRRSQLTDDHEHGQPFLDGYRPALLEQGLYHADGQILDEVYVYGSFLQSAMHAAGVICSDCHEPHAAKLRAEGNALCARCHAPAVYNSKSHHRHGPQPAAVECVDCHMRSETYMVIDPRRDHSFRVPRPDLSQRIGSPNACNDCHTDRTAAWSAAQTAAWYPQGRHTQPHYGDALQSARNWSADHIDRLLDLVDDGGQPTIVRATAIDLLGRQIDARVVDRIAMALGADDPLLRLAALEQAAGLPAELRLRLIAPLLDDPLLALRSAAASALITLRDRLRGDEAREFRAALDELIAAQTFNADRPEGLTALAGIASNLGEQQRALTYLETSIRRHPDYAAAYANLADLHRAAGREAAAREILEAGLDARPGDAGLHLALGLSLVRSGRPDEALVSLEVAIGLAVDVPHYQYVYGIALHSTGESERALGVLEAAHDRFPGHRDILFGLATLLRDEGRTAEALTYARRLQTLAPSDRSAIALIDELSGGR